MGTLVRLPELRFIKLLALGVVDLHCMQLFVLSSVSFATENIKTYIYIYIYIYNEVNN